jgi:hypothetical protein
MDERSMDIHVGGRPRPSEDYHEKPKRRAPSKLGGFLKKRWWVVVILVVLVTAVGFLAYGYITTRNELTRLSAAEDSGKSEVEKLVNEIGANLRLPDETPTLATVSDAAKLKDQEFFKHAKNGDRVLIFAETGKALLYRPSEKKVIEYSKVNLSNTSAQ